LGGKNGITVGLPPVLLYGRFSVMIVMRGTTRAAPAARTTWISLPSHSSTADVRESLRPPPVGGTVKDCIWMAYGIAMTIAPELQNSYSE